MVAEVERLLAAQRTRFAMRALKMNGRKFGAVLSDTGAPEAARSKTDHEEYRVVQEVIRLRRFGMTLTRIAVELASRGVRTRRGGRWSAEPVRILLRARASGDADGLDYSSAPPSARS
jgi:DNA invertase Pin-like site-specific DNA recombinase